MITNSRFPKAIDNLIFYQDVNIDNVKVFNTIQEYITNGEYTKASEYLKSQDISAFNADLINALENRIKVTQEYILGIKKKAICTYGLPPEVPQDGIAWVSDDELIKNIMLGENTALALWYKDENYTINASSSSGTIYGAKSSGDYESETQEALSGYVDRNITLNIINGVNTISDYGFTGISNLTELDLPDNTIVIGDYVFQNTAITKLNTKNTTSIGNYSFANTPIEVVSFTDNLAIIGTSAFEGAKFTTIILPDDIISIGDKAFMTINAIESIIYKEIEYTDGTALCSALLANEVTLVNDGLTTFNMIYTEVSSDDTTEVNNNNNELTEA